MYSLRAVGYLKTHAHIFMFFFVPSTVDHSRICLQLGMNDYINGSLIRVEETQRNYILTQVSRERSVCCCRNETIRTDPVVCMILDKRIFKQHALSYESVIHTYILIHQTPPELYQGVSLLFSLPLQL